ncbi:nibrin [Agrilus planipennis]|uniref:Nibrin n=1 Tax=Agrilus planipennis TaxID=224129 RepID=A0A1W4XM57_AGRPL|nr:nibrin [Agrilus planipennis]
MLFYLKDKEGSILYLLKDKYTIGRKDADILLTNDQSISRNHALLKLDSNRIILVDCGAKYKTYVDNTKLQPHEDTILSPGNTIKFGAFESIYKVGCINIVTAHSCLTKEEKKKVICQINFLNGCCVSNWTPECTHLTVNELKLTVKMLCCLIEGKPIVTVKFWEDFAKNVKENHSPPDPNNYKPPCTEIMLNKNLPLDFKEERKHLFRNKVFVFMTEADKETVELVIKYAGGQCISWEKEHIKKEDIDNPEKEYLIVQNTDSPTKIQSQELIDLIEHLKQTGKRLIPFTELALAIVNCSCEKDCNPNFDRNAALLKATSSQLAAPCKILVTETQTQQEEHSKNTQNNATIPPSFDNSSCSSQNFAPKINSTFAEPKVANKRIAEDHVDKLTENISKKAKMLTENFAVFINKKNKEITKANNAFDIFTNKKGDKDSSSGTSETKENSISTAEPKKRKFDFVEPDEKQNSLVEITKKINLDKDEVDNISLLQSKILKSSTNHFSSSGKTNQNSTTNILSGSWISINNSTNKIEEVCKQEDIDEEMLRFVNSFRNSVVIVEKNLIKCKPKANTLSINAVSNSNRKDFKKFKRVKPLKEQSTIIPRSECVRVICNSDAVLQPQAHEEDNDDNDDIEFINGPIQSKQQNTSSKKKPLKFEI